MRRKNTTHIRIYPEDKEFFRSWSKALGKKSPELFKDIRTSKNLQLEKRLLEEYKKKDADLRRRMEKI